MSGRRVIFKPMALDDVEETFIFLYDRSPQAASAFVDATHLTARVVAKRPGIGRRWHHGEQDLPEVRSVAISGFRAWLMVYTDQAGTIHVLRVVHGARDLDAGLDLGVETPLG